MLKITTKPATPLFIGISGVFEKMFGNIIQIYFFLFKYQIKNVMPHSMRYLFWIATLSLAIVEVQTLIAITASNKKKANKKQFALYWLGCYFPFFAIH